MSSSPLVNYTRLSPNNSGRRTHVIDTITIHHMAGNLTVEECGNVFATRKRQASSNYGIGSDGRIGLYVDEDNRAWTSSSSANDNRAITIEVANSKCAEPWPVSDAAYNALITLLTDICQRRNIKQLLWKADKSLIGQVDKQNMTAHRWFAATACPGNYLYNHFGDIADKVNANLANGTTPSNPIDTSIGVDVNYKGKVKVDSTLNCRAQPTINSIIVTNYNNGDLVTITKEQGGWGYTGEGWVSLNYIVKEEEEEMTQETFNKFMDNYLQGLINQPATFEQDALVWCNKNGIILGDETGNLMPKKFMTRGELAVVLKRFKDKFDKLS